MATTPNDQLLAWLNDAYAMEQSMTQVLRNHLGDAKNNPALQARLQQHLEETKQHGELVKGLITVAQQLGALQVAQVCRQILQRTIVMAQFLDQPLPLVVQLTLQQEAPAQ